MSDKLQFVVIVVSTQVGCGEGSSTNCKVCRTFWSTMAGDKRKLDITTQLVHSGERTEPLSGQPTSTPIYASTTFTYGSMEEIDRVFAGDQPGYIYTRYGNPTVTVLE